MKPTESPAYLAIQKRLKCTCERPFKKKDGTCGKCYKRLR